MRFSNEIDVARPPQELFAALTDMERVAPCLPGASIEGRDGDEYLGRMNVRVGPISATYRGRLRFVEVDEQQRRAVIKARAEELNGYGTAEARLTTSVEQAGDGSRIGVETDLQMRGRLAQFGRGAIGPIATRMLAEFATNLEALLRAPAEQPAAAGRAQAGAGPAQPVATGRAGEAASLDVAGLVAPGLRRVLLPVACAVLGFGYGYLIALARERRRLLER